MSDILIIDDDPRNIFALSAFLKAMKYTCFSAANASQGIALLKSAGNIGIVLMDMMMPEMDGYEAIGLIRNDKQLSGIPIIAVTAQAMPGDKEKCINAGADAYVSKPIDIDQLTALIKKHLKE